MISISCKNSISLDGCNAHINNCSPIDTYTFFWDITLSPSKYLTTS